MHVTCPSCDKSFKVTEAVLGKAKGLVRCGQCKLVFNALPLVKNDDVLTLAPVLAIPIAPSQPTIAEVATAVADKVLPTPETVTTVKEAFSNEIKLPKKRFKFLNREVTVLLAAAAISPLIADLIERIPPYIKTNHVRDETVIENLVPVLEQINPPVAVKKFSTPAASVIATDEPKTTKDATFTSSEPVTESQIDSDDNVETVKQPIITFGDRNPEELMTEAKSLLLNRNGPYDQAIDDLRSIILSQPVAEAREAHELLGYAYEKSKKLDKAMHEYQQYLALYPEQNDDRIRVRQRLMTLEITDPSLGSRTPGGFRATKEPRKGDNFLARGNFSTYFYVDKSDGSKQVESLNAVNLFMEAQHNQYTLSSRVKLTNVKNFTNPAGDRTTISNAYVDFEDTFKDYDIRLGRQPTAAGAISRFDGVSAKFPVSDNMKITLAAGNPFISPYQKTDRKFQGIEVDWSVNRDLTLSTYVNRQTADKFLERMALGGSAQYTEKNINILLRTEYDTAYHTLNMLTLQGIKYAGPYDLFFLYDRRKSPMPYGDLALGLGLLGPNKEVYTSVGDVVNRSGLSVSDIYTYISGTTPVASAFVLGASKKVSKDWTATVNLQSTNLSTTPGFNVAPQFNPVPIQVGQANTYSFNVHLKGDSIFMNNNTVELVGNKGFGANKSFYLTAADEFRYGERKQNSISAILRYDSYEQQWLNTHSTTGILRGFYGISENKMFEAQVSRTLSVTAPFKGPTEPNTNTTFYIGFRYDF